MGEQIIQRTFAGGELAPILHARADQAKYLSGLRQCHNFLIRKEGGVTARPGFRFVDGCKDNVAGKRLMRYISSEAGGSVLIEIGDSYFRFFHNDGTGAGHVLVSGVAAYNGGTAYFPGDLVVSGGVNYYCIANTTGNAPPNATFWYALTGNIYEIPTPYPAGHLFKWNQSGNVITLTHPAHSPRELIFEGLTRWVLRLVDTRPTLSAPGGLGGVPGAAGALTYKYVVTAAAADSYEESNPSAVVTIAACAKPTEAAPNTVTWGAVAGAAEYYVYLDPYGNGVYGFIGTAASTTFKDAGLIPDFDVTPPIPRVLFTTANNLPSASTSFQQRRFFANTVNEPDAIYGSRIGFPSNFGISSPLQDDDAVTFRLAGNNQHPVRFLVALKAGLVVFTDGGEWTMTGGAGPKSPITPNSVDAEQETYVGIAPDVRPVVVGNSVLYVQARGSVVRDLQFEQQVEGLNGKDLTIWATHLFEGFRINAIDYQQVPDSIIWCVRNDGALIGLTYIPNEEVWGWHVHETLAAGVFEDVCVVPEDEHDAVYVIVKRTINGGVVRYVERLESRTINNVDRDSFFVDSGLTYDSTVGPPVDAVAGLEHLEGELVAVCGDGDLVFDGDPTGKTPAEIAAFTVTAGQIDLPSVMATIHVGKRIPEPQIETLDLDVQGSDIRGKRKRVANLTVLVERSNRQWQAGPDDTHLRPYMQQDHEVVETLHTGQLEITLTSGYDQYGRVLIRNATPLPLTILGVIPNVDEGG